MNPTYNRAASKQRALERRSEKDKLQQLEGSAASMPNHRFKIPAPASIEGGFPASHPPLGAHAFDGWEKEGTGFDPEDGGIMAVTSIFSSWSMGLVEDFSDVALEYVELMGQQLEGTGDPSAQEPSPLAPGHLGSDRSNSNPGRRSDEPESMFGRDTEASRQDSLGLGFNRDFRRRAVRELNWERRPGETSITQSVRLYLSDLDPDISHKDNCEMTLRQILEQVGLEELDVPAFKTRHVIKIEAFLRGVVLSVPPRSWQQSVRGAFARAAPAATGTSSNNSKHVDHGHQISEEELSFRMSVFVSILKAERSGSNEADVAVDGMRVESVLRSFVANAAEILPLQRPARTLLPPLLLCMACDVLGVRLLAPEIRDVFSQIVSDFEERAKLWMSPLQNAERYLRPLLTEFAAWLRHNRDVLYQACATEGLLWGIDPALRSSLKNQVYRSPEHFLEVLDSLSAELSDMPLPPYDPSDFSDPSGCDQGRSFDVSQTLKDVSRERFEVNGFPTEPSECFRQIRSLFLKATSDLPSTPSSGTPNFHPLEKHVSTKMDYEDGEGCLGLETACGDAAAGKLSVMGQGMSDPEVYAERCAWRVLHAASRTASGGDSFFVVQDLFGGEGVLVKTATAAPERIKIVTRGMTARVTTVDKHDIYHTSDVDIETSTSEASPRPLMTIITTMKEVVQFASYTSDDLSPHKACSQHVSGDMQHSFSRSGRFITISASLPNYPDHRLHDLDNKLVAPPCTPETSASLSGHGRGDDDSLGGRLSRRPSAFSSPLPPSFDIKHIDGSNIPDSGT